MTKSVTHGALDVGTTWEPGAAAFWFLAKASQIKSEGPSARSQHKLAIASWDSSALAH